MLALCVLLQVAVLVGADTSAKTQVGDPVVVSVRVHLPDGATLIDRVPRTRDTLPDGVKVLSADTLRREGADWVGRVRVGFFRPDSQAVPALAIAYQMANAVDTAVSRPIAMFVQHVLPVGTGTLRDIREIDTPVVPWRSILVALIVLGVGVLAMRIRRRARARRAQVVPVVVGPQPLEIALTELAAIEQRGWDVGRQAAAAADVVRSYLAVARGIPALERTTPEIRRLVAGDGALGALLEDADRVKFARGSADAAFVERARAVLRELAA
jgi:hypothetical protein